MACFVEESEDDASTKIPVPTALNVACYVLFRAILTEGKSTELF